MQLVQGQYIQDVHCIWSHHICSHVQIPHVMIPNAQEPALKMGVLPSGGSWCHWTVGEEMGQHYHLDAQQVRLDAQQVRLDAQQVRLDAQQVRLDAQQVRPDTHGRYIRHATRSDQQGVVLTLCTLHSHTSRETVAISPQPPVRGKPVHSQVQLYDVQPFTASACTCVHRNIPQHGEAVEVWSR